MGKRDEEGKRGGKGTNRLPSLRAMRSTVLDVDGVADEESVGTATESSKRKNEGDSARGRNARRVEENEFDPLTH